MTFSAIHSTLVSGSQVFISVGASVFGVSWNTIRMPSTSISSMGLVIKRVGAIRPTAPAETPWPRPWLT